MELEAAIKLLKKAVKHTGTIDQKHIDLTIVSAEDRELYQLALKVAQESVKQGLLTREILLNKLGIQ